MTATVAEPQGGPLSPLLANIYLDALDKELEKRGHCFCRYADDCNIYVGSQTAAERTLTSIRDWIEKHLRLKVNAAKSGTATSEAGGVTSGWPRRGSTEVTAASTAASSGVASPPESARSWSTPSWG